MRCERNLFRIQNAILQYQAENGTLPPAFTVDEAGKPLHSWRVLILPYLGEKERDLYSKIRLDEPWDSDYNRQFQTETPDVYHCPSNPTTDACYSVVVGPNSLFDESGKGKNLTEPANDLRKNAPGQALVLERLSPICWMRPDSEISEEFAKSVNFDAPISVSPRAEIGSSHDSFVNIVSVSGEDPIVSTTGKASRELFEIREANKQSHKYDFLTVGSMGHSSSIALGVAINKQEKKIWCIDGDGALLMHMGSMAVLGANKPKNMVHIVINNSAHETVGGMPTVAGQIDIVGVAKACGYPNAVCVDSFEKLDAELAKAKSANELSLIEIKCSIGARDDLGRPTTTALENKQNFMENLKQ